MLEAPANFKNQSKKRLLLFLDDTGSTRNRINYAGEIYELSSHFLPTARMSPTFHNPFL